MSRCINARGANRALKGLLKLVLFQSAVSNQRKVSLFPGGRGWQITSARVPVPAGARGG